MHPLRTLRYTAMWLLLLVLPAAAAGPWEGPAAELVRRILEAAGRPAAVSLAVTNASSLAAADVAEIHRQIETELRGRSVEVVEAARAVAEIRITLSENAQGHLWAAEIQQGQSREVVLLGFERSAAQRVAAERPPMVIRRRLVFEHPEPILDLAELEPQGATRLLLVLHAGRVALYRQAGDGWEQQSSFAVRGPNPFPRDGRGRLVATRALTFDVYLPGVKCSGTIVGTLGANCSVSDDPWPLSASGRVNGFFHPARNFFQTAALRGTSEKDVPPFFSAAEFASDASARWVFASVDGAARLYEEGEQPVARFAAWGSELTAVRSGCGSGWQVLATSASDWTARDTVRAFEISGREAAAASNELQCAGPVVALWPAEEGTAALAVVRNLDTGNYEAFSLSVACQ